MHGPMNIKEKRFFEHLQFWFRTANFQWFAFYVFRAAVPDVYGHINIFQKQSKVTVHWTTDTNNKYGNL